MRGECDLLASDQVLRFSRKFDPLKSRALRDEVAPAVDVRMTKASR
jgi:hypothetical protein